MASASAFWGAALRLRLSMLSVYRLSGPSQAAGCSTTLLLSARWRPAVGRHGAGLLAASPRGFTNLQLGATALPTGSGLAASGVRRGWLRRGAHRFALPLPAAAPAGRSWGARPGLLATSAGAAALLGLLCESRLVTRPHVHLGRSGGRAGRQSRVGWMRVGAAAHCSILREPCRTRPACATLSGLEQVPGSPATPPVLAAQCAAQCVTRGVSDTHTHHSPLCDPPLNPAPRAPPPPSPPPPPCRRRL